MIGQDVMPCKSPSYWGSWFAPCTDENDNSALTNHPNLPTWPRKNFMTASRTREDL